MKKLISIVLLLAFYRDTAAQYPRVDIPGSEVRKITSSVVKGQEYELHILLPGNYRQQTKEYPVLYILDSQWDFPLIKSIYGQQYYDGFIPELIICGITWGGVNPNHDSLRVRDYTPTNDGQRVQGGGAAGFLSFIEQEVFPFMKSNYRASNERLLAGCSLGGLFTLYTMFTRADLFRGYIAASPAIGWDREVLYQFEKDFAKKQPETPVKLYMTVGDVERSMPVFEKFATHVGARQYKNVMVNSKILEQTGHSGTKSETYNRGLQFAFQRNNLKLPDNVLKKYTGTYQLPDGSNIDLKLGSDGLSLSDSQNKVALLVNTEKHWYALHEFFNIYFNESNGQVTGFDLARFGGRVFVKKLKDK